MLAEGARSPGSVGARVTSPQVRLGSREEKRRSSGGRGRDRGCLLCYRPANLSPQQNTDTLSYSEPPVCKYPGHNYYQEVQIISHFDMNYI